MARNIFTLPDEFGTGIFEDDDGPSEDEQSLSDEDPLDIPANSDDDSDYTSSEESDSCSGSELESDLEEEDPALQGTGASVSAETNERGDSDNSDDFSQAFNRPSGRGASTSVGGGRGRVRLRGGVSTSRDGRGRTRGTRVRGGSRGGRGVRLDETDVITEEIVNGQVLRHINYTSKDNITWRNTPYIRTRTSVANSFRNPTNRIPGANAANTPVEVYNLFLSKNIVNEIVSCTNEEGARQRGELWVKTDCVEIECLMGMFLYIGSQKQSKTSSKTLWTPLIGQEYVRAVMSRNRYFELTNALRFDRKDTRRRRLETDKLAHIRRIHEMHEENLRSHYIPGAYLTIDEQLVPFRGRCSFLQYMPSKPAKYGLKVFWVCDASNAYPLKSIPYIGKGSYEAGDTGLLQGGEIVIALAQPWLNKGRNITTDNFFTDHALTERLLSKKTTLIGTVRRNRKFLPKKFQAKKHLKINQSLFGFQEKTMLVSYQSHKPKNVILLSSMHDDPTTLGGEKNKPAVVIDYNKTKGGVDTMDKMCLSFTTKRKTKRWPLVLFMNILDVSTVAARVVYGIKFPQDRLSKKDFRGDFIREVAKGLMMNNLVRRNENLTKASHPLKALMGLCLLIWWYSRLSTMKPIN